MHDYRIIRNVDFSAVLCFFPKNPKVFPKKTDTNSVSYCKRRISCAKEMQEGGIRYAY